MKEQHWTDEQLIAHLYGAGPADNHISRCEQCAGRAFRMQSARQSVEAANSGWDEPGPEFLSAQRRAIYARLERPRWKGLPSVLVRRWAPVFAMVAALAGGALLLEQRQATAARRISDAQLFLEVDRLAEEPTPNAVAPMEGMFDR